MIGFANSVPILLVLLRGVTLPCAKMICNMESNMLQIVKKVVALGDGVVWEHYKMYLLVFEMFH